MRSNLWKGILGSLFQLGVSLILILFFTGFGKDPSFKQALHTSLSFVIAMFSGSNLGSEFAGVKLIDAWNSLRLILFSTCFAVVCGSILAIASIRLRNKWALGFHEVLTVTFESIPEPVYVMLVFMVVYFSLTKLGFNIPGIFPESSPNWGDTVVPAIALGLPSVFYLQRVMFLRLREEINSLYTNTARSKGASEFRIFYLHVIPNTLSTLIGQISVIIGLVLSSALFAEFFLGYQGILFRFTTFIGWKMDTGLMSLVKTYGIPTYQIGATFIVGLFFMIVWLGADVGTKILMSIMQPSEISTTSVHLLRRIDYRWIIAGAIPIMFLIVTAVFPHLLTNQSPFQQHLLTSNFSSPPFPPSDSHPFGTDLEGRDNLALTIHGTLNTLGLVALIAVIVTFVSLSVAIMISTRENQWSVQVSRVVGQVVSSMPTVFILFLAMYHRNMSSPYQEIQYILWVVVIESARSIYPFVSAIQEWFKFNFVDGAVAVGKKRIYILVENLGGWLRDYTLEFGFSELTRVMSLMTILAMFHIYPIEHLVEVQTYGQVELVIQSNQFSWFSILGDASNQVGEILSYPYLIFAPLCAVLLSVIGAGLISRGFRGRV